MEHIAISVIVPIYNTKRDGLHWSFARCVQIPDDPARQDALLQQFDAAVQELLYLGMHSEELRRRIPEGGTNHD